MEKAALIYAIKKNIVNMLNKIDKNIYLIHCDLFYDQIKLFEDQLHKEFENAHKTQENADKLFHYLKLMFPKINISSGHFVNRKELMTTQFNTYFDLSLFLDNIDTNELNFLCKICEMIDTL